MAMAVTYTTFDGEIIHENRGGVQRDYVADTLGSTQALLDSTGAVTDTFDYWPYGEIRSRTGTTDTPFTFVGTLGYFADSLKRLYVRARHYLNQPARWLTVDPLWPAEPPYKYANGNPIASVDPEGLSIVLPPPPQGISPAVWAQIVAYLVALGYDLALIAVLLSILILVVVAIGVLCRDFASHRYKACPSPGGRGPSGMSSCRGVIGCFRSMQLADLWAKCAATQLFLNAVCHPGNTSHDQALKQYISAFEQCLRVAEKACDPGRCVRQLIGI